MRYIDIYIRPTTMEENYTIFDDEFDNENEFEDERMCYSGYNWGNHNPYKKEQEIGITKVCRDHGEVEGRSYMKHFFGNWQSEKYAEFSYLQHKADRPKPDVMLPSITLSCSLYHATKLAVVLNSI